MYSQHLLKPTPLQLDKMMHNFNAELKISNSKFRENMILTDRMIERNKQSLVMMQQLIDKIKLHNARAKAGIR